MEPVGLAFGVLGVSGLFVSCIQNFNIIVQTKTFSKDFDLLCAELASLRLRLQTWGEAMGIVSGPDEEPLPPSVHLDRPDVNATFERILFHLCSLLEDAGGVTNRYAIVDEAPPGAGTNMAILHSSKGMDIFREGFDNFKNSLKRSQKQTSAWKLIRWAVHDLDNFKDIIDKITRLLDNLEKATNALDSSIVRRQNAMMTREVESVSDTQSLRLLQDLALITHASSSASQRLISDAASIHLTSIIESNQSGSNRSYHTAPTHPESQRSRSSVYHANMAFQNAVARADVASSFPVQQEMADTQEGHSEHKSPEDSTQGLPPETLSAQPSQNRLIMDQALRKRQLPTPGLSFASGSAAYGQAITAVREVHEKDWQTASTSLLVQADRGDELARRVFVELRSIRRAEIPFISATPLHDRLDVILASIEGPPDTPYEKGIFWLLARFDPSFPTKPPRLRFLTRIYHPNIDCEGQVCAQYPELANVPISPSARGSNRKRPENLSWFAGESPARFYLGALLTALCSLLASPDVEDPLVLEIAETYITDHAAFVQNARQYTEKYATKGRPEMDAIRSCITAWDGRLEPGASLTRPSPAQAHNATPATASTLLPESDAGSLHTLRPSDRLSIRSRKHYEESWPGESTNYTETDSDEDLEDLDPVVRESQEFRYVSAQKTRLNWWLVIFEVAKVKAMAETEGKAGTDAKTKAEVREFITKVTFLESQAKARKATYAIGLENHKVPEERRKLLKAHKASLSEAVAQAVRSSSLECLEMALDILRRIRAILEDPEIPMKDKLVFDMPPTR
ncbi:hypothetical protein B0T11DRAFT_288216 [Plectosphaerella cucumerina]|uniref:UBC core domain-containing protein n=1 Tax=Plectosphaerella cucumerina TaxID=40658 RepID=A0A8K0TB26_9PEZI|nr:hypothetical protein B0T11DRAFT_288216 [Plectosphaerella cucumerina]